MHNIDFFKNLRREAYVHAINRKIEGKPIAGTFGNVDEGLLRACDIIPYPIVSVEGYIFKHGQVKESCHPINASRIYLETGKCPLLFSAGFIVHDGMCPYFVKEISKVTDKDFVAEENLKNYLKDGSYIFNPKKYTDIKAKLNKIDQAFNFLATSDIDSKLLAYAKFYMRFEPDLDRRIEILQELTSEYKNINNIRKTIKVPCPYGIIDGIDCDNFSIIESTSQADFAPYGCAFCDKYIKYEV